MGSQIESLRLALAHSPDNLPLVLLYAKACLDELQLGDARIAFTKAAQLSPSNADAKLGLAKLAHLEGKTSEAVVRAEQIIQEHPSAAAAHVFLSRMLAGEGELPRAKALYDEALRLDRNLTDPGLEKMLTGIRAQESTDSTPPQRKLGLTGEGEAVEDWLEDDEEPRGGSAFDLGLADFERPDMSFADVGGMEAVKEEIRMKIIYPLQHKDLFKMYNKKIGGGVLLYGPPGCGKTLISKATAGEIKANFIALGLHQILDMWIGSSEKNMHEVFQLARNNAPCVLFFDEVDALAADRRDLRQSAGRNLINQFLSEMDGAGPENDGVLILGATNAPWHIDPAFRRPGRFDRTLFIPPPDTEARSSIIEVMAKHKPIGQLDPVALAKKTDGFSGADLKAMFDLATEDVLTEAMKTGQVVPLSTKDLAKAAARHKPTTKAWFESARNYAMYSNQSGFYDDVLKYLGLLKK